MYLTKMKKRRIRQLVEDELVALEEGYRNSDKNYYRERCKSILMSNSGYTVKEIATLFDTRIRTIYAWFNRFESLGVTGLLVKPGQGRKPILDISNSNQFAIIEKAVNDHPQNISGIAEEVSKSLGFDVPSKVLKRYLKKKDYRWKRMRRSVYGAPNPDDYAIKKKLLTQLLALELSGYVDIYFGDESGFSLTPSVPYGWQKIGETQSLPTQKSARINVFGLLSRSNKFESYIKTGSNTSSTIIAYIDDFAKTREQRTVIILDNAPIHKSKEFKMKIKEWKKLDLHIFFLPTYSPHLNLIETLWRKMKYEWLKPSDYNSIENLTIAVENILAAVGERFMIDFKTPDVANICG